MDLITVTREEMASADRRLAAQFPGAVLLGTVVVRHGVAIYCSDAKPTRMHLKALLLAAQRTAAILGQEILIDVVERSAEPPS